ncbi:alpha/beta hydrolase [Salisediminibacterium beveridgei]|uniref:Putative hydrolase MhqD n=1 Tax=Salisediminibacterium beveridgei TaxID=632773 RepID=A0A1D7QXH1_9BACI|nr:alpha/beta hydrolase [Salisediminibacterium beveridgei]AOM83712.1 Putative hydrolase MhqD [Salisediminibacterium beveridgei]
MHHIYKRGDERTKETLLLLHGTGGDENDLLPLADMIDPMANVLSVRGNVDENGMNRFFRRLSEGVFDEEDLIFRTKELYDFIDEASVKYGFDRSHVVAVGYSNGANIAASLLYHYERPLRAAALHHPMVPRSGIDLPDMSGLPVFIGAGENDPICPPEQTEKLNKDLTKQGAAVELFWEQQGHQLSRGEVDRATLWYKSEVSGVDPS